MSREKEDFRPMLERLLEVYGKDSLTITEACQFTGLDRRTLLKQKDFPAIKTGQKYTVPTVRLARWMS